MSGCRQRFFEPLYAVTQQNKVCALKPTNSRSRAMTSASSGKILRRFKTGRFLLRN